MKAKFGLLSGALAATFVLAGCHKEPKGQVLAIVNGEDITGREVDAELKSTRIPRNADGTKILKSALQRLIDRKLLVQEARKQGLDKTPDFLSEKSASEDRILVNLLGRKIETTVPPPTDSAVSDYIANTPSQFSGRERLVLDQIQFDAPRDPKQLAVLRDAHSLDDVAVAVRKLGLAMARGRSTIDTAVIDPNIAKMIISLPPGEPFILPSDGRYLANVVVGKENTPTESASAKRAATILIRNQALEKERAAQIARIRQAAEIQYQPGYEPDGSPIKASQAAAMKKK